MDTKREIERDVWWQNHRWTCATCHYNNGGRCPLMHDDCDEDTDGCNEWEERKTHK